MEDIEEGFEGLQLLLYILSWSMKCNSNWY
jgi:hypothetical protein